MADKNTNRRDSRVKGDSGIVELTDYEAISRLMPKDPKNWFDARAYEKAIPLYRRAIELI